MQSCSSSSFHHVIDETKAAASAFAQLRDGGYLAICGESRWLPGNEEQAHSWTAEMERYGTLESPFTREYLRHVLERAGFDDVEFLHTLTRLVPIRDEARPVREVAENGSADYLNTVIARRPWWQGPRIADHPEGTSAEIRVARVNMAEPGLLDLAVTLTNSGRTMWPNNPSSRGWVAVALFGQDANGVRVESRNRERLPRPVLPGEHVALTCRFAVDGLAAPFHLNLVANDFFWFEQSAVISDP